MCKYYCKTWKICRHDGTARIAPVIIDNLDVHIPKALWFLGYNAMVHLLYCKVCQGAVPPLKALHHGHSFYNAHHNEVAEIQLWAKDCKANDRPDFCPRSVKKRIQGIKAGSGLKCNLCTYSASTFIYLSCSTRPTD
jgi:hypothetical protein